MPADAGACFLGIPEEVFAEAPPPGRIDCEGIGGGDRTVLAQTNQYRNQPLFHAVVGAPTLLFPNDAGAYLMRLAGAAACAALLASAAASIRLLTSGRVAGIALACAVTPEVLYVAGTTNTAGPEMAATAAVFATGLALATGDGSGHDRLVVRFGVCLIVLALSRPLSPLVVAVAVVSCAVVAGWSRARRLWVESRLRAVPRRYGRRHARQQRLGALRPRSLPVATVRGSRCRRLARSGRLVDARLGRRVRFDRCDPTRRPTHRVGGDHLDRGRPRRCAAHPDAGRWSSVGLTLLALGLLVSGEGLAIPDTGYWWQGRYVMPFLIGAVVTAGALGSRTRCSAAGPAWRPSAPWSPCTSGRSSSPHGTTPSATAARRGRGASSPTRCGARPPDRRRCGRSCWSAGSPPPI